MKTRAYRILAFFILLGLMPGGASSADRKSPAKNYAQIETSNANELVFQILPKAYANLPLQVGGKLMEGFEATLSGSSSEPGKPDLPVEGYLLGVPPGKQPVVEIIESKFAIDEGKEVAPAPSHTFTSEGEAVPQYKVDQAFYESFNQFYPVTSVEIGDVVQLRDLRVARVIVHPLQYNPVTKQLRRFTHLKLKVSFKQQPAPQGKIQLAWMPVTGPDPYFEPLYKDLVINYNDAWNWRGRSVSTLGSNVTDSTGTWFQTGRTYYRIPVAADGIYRLSYNTLLSYGINLTMKDNSTAALYYQGQSQPLVMQTQDLLPQNWYIEFYAQRRYGTNSGFDPYCDTSMYWLTWNDSRPHRFIDVSAPSLPSVDSVRWYIETLHQEKDLNYFFGVTQDDIENTDEVSGEGWYWKDFNPDTSRSFVFLVDSVQRLTGTPVQLHARFYGMTTCTTSWCRFASRHSAQLKLNRVLIGTISWTDNAEAIFNGSLPDSILRVGNDTLLITSTSPKDSNNSEFYLDWFEVKYPRPIRALNGVVKFTSPFSSGQDTLAFVVKGISRDSASVYDLTYGRRVLTLASYGSQALAFSDTASAPKTYLVVKQANKLLPAYMTSKMFANLRVNNRGADYIVITHPWFRSAADRLAQYRGGTNQLRTFVVNVQDIYDEFNFGHLDPEAIRSFLKNSYYSWKHPSPTYVAMFGDASWDFKRILSSSVKVNYVPSFGNPPSDNALVSFDSVRDYIPFMLIGRIPVENATEADQVVSKIINYETTPVGDWSKTFLFITGGNTSSEKSTFNFWSNDLINRYVTEYPFGGLAYKVYKATDAIIDGESKQYMQQLMSNGIVFVNFIGHSGGRIWGVDMGSPYSLQNTTGQLPFVSSVSCNVGFFSDPQSNVLAEDFLMADNRGAIAVWAAAGIGYGSVGRALDDKFLSAATVNYAREFGLLTTISRLYFWVINSVTTPLVIQTLHLHPLVGDPCSRFAVPLQPDFDISSGDAVLRTQPPTADSSVTLSANISNRGLMSDIPILVSVQDSYVDEHGLYKGTSDAVPSFYLPDFIWKDSFTVMLNVRGKPGTHTLTIQIDPKDSIAELRKDNNVIQKSVYVYRNVISVLRPAPMSVVSNSTPVFAVTVPAGSDTTPLSYTFTVDTVPDFSSPAKITSPPIAPVKVYATWPAALPLSVDRTYYWSSQSSGASTLGVPITSSFYLSSSAPGADTVVWRQKRLGQFKTNSYSMLSMTDSGITMLFSDSTKLFARSVGSHYSDVMEFYSVLRINDVVATGYWWVGAYSYLLGRYDPASGSYLLKGYSLVAPGGIDSVIAFLSQTPVGNYVMLSAVLNAKQNATDSLYGLIQQLGSVYIRSVQPGQSWLMISRKGDGRAIVENYMTNGVVVDSVIVPNVYSSGSGQMLTQPTGPASKWIKMSWNVVTPNTNANASTRVVGIRSDGKSDSLMTIPASTSQVDLTGVNPQLYPKLQLSATLSNLDGRTTPVLKQWDVTYLPVPDLAVSAWTFAATPATVSLGGTVSLSLDVYNIGYERADSSHVVFYFLEDTTNRATAVLDSIAVGSHRRVQSQLMATNLVDHTVVARVDPKTGTNDLILENNLVSVPITVTSQSISHLVSVLFDGVEIRDGDYTVPKPIISVVRSQHDSLRALDLHSLIPFVDKKRYEFTLFNSPAKTAVQSDAQQVTLHDPLADGEHTFELYELSMNNRSTLVHAVSFRVTAVPQLLQVYNFPNPFARQTAFTFIATGSQVPDEVRIKVYTVAGRMIRDIRMSPSQLQLGFNSIFWDGRDQDGDEVANGTYLYRITMKSGDKTVAAVERMARVQ